MKRYVIDLDHTLCDTKKGEDGKWDYSQTLEDGIAKTYTWILSQIKI